jgi:hypothetical protein
MTDRADIHETIVILDPIEDLPRIVGEPVIGSPPPPPKILTLTELEERGPSARVVEALRQVSKRLTAQGVRHAVLGALGIGIYGWPRATNDVDLLLGPEAWHTTAGGTQTELVELPKNIGSVGIDYLCMDIAGDFLLESFDRAYITEGVPIAPVEVVIATKLIRLAMRDAADIVELVKAGLTDLELVAAYLDRHAPMLTGRLRALAEQALKEKSRGH